MTSTVTTTTNTNGHAIDTTWNDNDQCRQQQQQQQQQQVMAYRTAQFAHHLRRLSQTTAAMIAPLTIDTNLASYPTVNTGTGTGVPLPTSSYGGNSSTSMHSSNETNNLLHLSPTASSSSSIGSVILDTPIHTSNPYTYPAPMPTVNTDFSSSSPSSSLKVDWQSPTSFPAATRMDQNNPIAAPTASASALPLQQWQYSNQYGYNGESSTATSYGLQSYPAPSCTSSAYGFVNPQYNHSTYAPQHSIHNYASLSPPYKPSYYQPLPHEDLTSKPQFSFTSMPPYIVPASSVGGLGIGIDPMQLSGDHSQTSSSVSGLYPNVFSQLPTISPQPSFPTTPRSASPTPFDNAPQSPQRPAFRRHSDSSGATPARKGRKRKATWDGGKAAEWESVVDKKERRKLQNRLAQRAFRARCKEAGGN